MSSPRIDHPDQLRLQWQGWMCSVLFHAIMAAGALTLLSGLQIQLPQDHFTWNVAMVEPPKPHPKVEAVPETKPAPPKPQVVESPPPPSQRVVQTVQQKMIQPVQAVPQVVQRQVTQTVQAPAQVATINQTASVVTQAVQQSDPSQTVAQSATREAVVQEEQIVTSEAPVVQELAAPLVTEVQTERAAMEPVIQQAPLETVTEPVMQSQPVVSRPAEPVVERTPVEAVSEPVAQAPQVATRSVEPVIERPTFENATEPTAATAPPATESIVAHNTAPATAPAPKADYGWLVKALLGRVDQIKRYPYLARLNQWEGKVILRAVIKDDGQVLTIDVHESSGRSILDNDAIETLRKASPLKLEHPLGKPQVAVLMPISYSIR